MEGGQIDMSQVRFAILDEADRMLDMGFEPQIRKIMEQVPSDTRQTAMFTATWPKECRKLAESYVKNPTQIQIGSDGISSNSNVRQHVEVVSDEKAKTDVLKKILGGLGRDSVCLVFCNTKRKCRDLCWEFNEDKRMGLPACELHGDLDQSQRDSALNDFRSGKARVMIATDVAARGLDIRNISIVVNADVPNTAEDYVHRIGRTGRAEDTGDAYTIFSTWGDEKKANFVKEVMEAGGAAVPQILIDVADGKGQPGSSSDNGGDAKRGGDDWGDDRDSKRGRY